MTLTVETILSDPNRSKKDMTTLRRIKMLLLMILVLQFTGKDAALQKLTLIELLMVDY